ncbi:hypothetical protein L195_g038326 [Trifolium pratense]|uniref:Uncharacterized protein n=1 Tax=Trifolium pratense TaxID=57577 RepID=A0A2K3LUT6_TRIPR|nr:hypothetical protein L195_g038326 [Trifolium pratense]
MSSLKGDEPIGEVHIDFREETADPVGEVTVHVGALVVGGGECGGGLYDRGERVCLFVCAFNVWQSSVINSG